MSLPDLIVNLDSKSSAVYWTGHWWYAPSV